MLYQRNVLITRRSMANIIELGHKFQIAGHLVFSKTMSRLENFHSRHKGRHLKRYVDGIHIWQQKKDHSGKNVLEPSSLKVLSGRWVYLATGFIVSLPKAKKAVENITTWGIDFPEECISFLVTVLILLSMFPMTYLPIFKHNGKFHKLVSHKDPKFTSRFCDRLMDLYCAKL